MLFFLNKTFLKRKLFHQENELLAQNVDVGGVAILEDENRFIYYLVTKPFSYETPTYADLASSLNEMKVHMVHNFITLIFY